MDVGRVLRDKGVNSMVRDFIFKVEGNFYLSK